MPITYRYVETGHGGTFSFNESGTSQEKVFNIGTTELETCTAVYLPISSQRCFFAHINAYTTSSHTVEGMRHGQIIADEVLKLLQRHSQAHGWSAQTVADYVNDRPSVQTPLIAAPSMEQFDSAYYVLLGVKRFLGQRVVVGRHAYPELWGFVVNHKTGERTEFGSRTKADRSESVTTSTSGFTKLPAAGATAEWQFTVRPPPPPASYARQ